MPHPHDNADQADGYVGTGEIVWERLREGNTVETPPPYPLTIEQLAQQTGLAVSTIRLYQTRGLLPGPQRRGRIGYYGAEHRRRLDQVKQLQDRGYSLIAIKDRLDGSFGPELETDQTGVLDLDLNGRFDSELADLDASGDDSARSLMARVLTATGLDPAAVDDELEVVRFAADRLARRLAPMIDGHPVGMDERELRQLADAVGRLVADGLDQALRNRTPDEVVL